MKYKTLILILILLIAPVVSSAQTATVPFGGKIIYGYPCTCSGGWYLSIYDLVTKATIPIVFQFGVSRLNASFNIFTSGVSVLGSYMPGTGVCLIYAGTGCTTIPTIGMVTSYPLPGIGTSAY